MSLFTTIECGFCITKDLNIQCTIIYIWHTKYAHMYGLGPHILHGKNPPDLHILSIAHLTKAIRVSQQ